MAAPESTHVQQQCSTATSSNGDEIKRCDWGLSTSYPKVAAGNSLSTKQMKVNGMFGSVIVRDKHPTDLNPTPIQAMCPRRLPTLSPVAHCTILAASLKLRSLCGPGRPGDPGISGV